MSTKVLPRYHVGEILGRIIGPEAGDLPLDAARAILGWKLHEQDDRKLGELLSKNREGELSSVEREELDDYLRVGSLMDLLRAKSFASLKRAGIDPLRSGDE